MSKESVKRVEEYIARRKKSRGIDIEHVHGFDVGPDCGVELLLSDIEAIISAAAPQVVADEPTMINGRFYYTAEQMRAALATAPVQPVAVPDGDPRPLFGRKLADLEQRGYEVIGRILHKGGQYALFDSSCRWLEKAQYQRLMHEQDGSLFAAPAAQGDAIRKVEVDDQGPLGVVTKTTYALANAQDARDAERLEFIESGTFDLRCYNDHDDDVYWNVIEHHMAAPIEREIGWGNTARQAIDAAIATKAVKS